MVKRPKKILRIRKEVAVTLAATLIASAVTVAGGFAVLANEGTAQKTAEADADADTYTWKEAEGVTITPALPSQARIAKRLALISAGEADGIELSEEADSVWSREAASYGIGDDELALIREEGTELPGAQADGRTESLDEGELVADDVTVSLTGQGDDDEDDADGDDGEAYAWPVFTTDEVLGELLREEEADAYEGAPLLSWDGARNIILDLDYNSDVDDVCALRLAAQMHNYGKINLQAVGLSTSGEEPAKAAHGQLCYDGLGDIPIGRSSVTVDADSPYWEEFIGAYFYEGNYKCMDAVELYKQKLRESGAAGQTTRFVTTGFVTNLAALLKDPEGYDLVRDYADSFYITGGGWLQGSDFNFNYTPACAEAIKYVVDNSPVPVVLSTNMSIKGDSGAVMMCGASMMRKDTDGDDPVTRAFRAFELVNNTSLSGGRFAWDPMCTWVACVNDDAQTRTHIGAIKVYIDGSNGYNQFYPDAADTNCHVIFRDSEDLGWYQSQLEYWVDLGLR